MFPTSLLSGLFGQMRQDVTTDPDPHATETDLRATFRHLLTVLPERVPPQYQAMSRYAATFLERAMDSTSDGALAELVCHVHALASRLHAHIPPHECARDETLDTILDER